MSTPRTDSFNQIEKQWFYADSSRTPKGPFSFAELQRLKAAGMITLETLVVAQGAQEWVPYARVVMPPELPPELPPIRQHSALGGSTPRQGDQAKEPKSGIGAAIEACSSRKWVVVVFLFLFCPIGLFLLWKGSAFDRPEKKLLTAVVLPLYLLLFISTTPTVAVTYHLSLGLVLFMIAVIRRCQAKTLWLYMDANHKAVGPITWGEILKLTIKREISYKTLVLPEGGDQWVPFTSASSVQGKYIASTKIDWFARSAVLPCLVFLAPLGLVLLWRSPKFGARGRMALTLPTCIFTLPICLIILISAIQQEESVQHPQPVQASARAVKPKAPPFEPLRMRYEVIVSKSAEAFREKEALQRHLAAHGAGESSDGASAEQPVAINDLIPDGTTSVIANVDTANRLYLIKATLPDRTIQEFWVSHEHVAYAPEVEESVKQEKLYAARKANAPLIQRKVAEHAKRILRDRLNKVDVSTISNLKGGYNVEIHFRVGSIFSERTARRQIADEMQKIYSAIYTDSTLNEIRNVWLFSSTTFSDRYGNERDDIAYKTSLHREVANQVVWSKADQLDFLSIWVEGYVHPAMK